MPWLSKRELKALERERERVESLLEDSVPRSLHEAVVSENERLRGQVDKLTDQLARLSRASNGLPETPREPRKPRNDVMPTRLLKYIRGFRNRNLRRKMFEDVMTRRREGETWAEIELDVFGPLDEVMEDEPEASGQAV